MVAITDWVGRPDPYIYMATYGLSSLVLFFFFWTVCLLRVQYSNRKMRMYDDETFLWRDVILYWTNQPIGCIQGSYLSDSGETDVRSLPTVDSNDQNRSCPSTTVLFYNRTGRRRQFLRKWFVQYKTTQIKSNQINQTFSFRTVHDTLRSYVRLIKSPFA